MSSDDELDRNVRALLESGDLERAVTRGLGALGAEIYGFLLASHRGDEGMASEVFSDFGERFWRGLGAFSWRCTLRGWAYVIARNASRTHLDQARRRARRDVPLSPTLASVLEQARTATRTVDRTGTRDAIARLREALPEEDRTLLILRLDRELPWEELARVFLKDEAEPSAETIQRESARLRKRFQLVKERLAREARQSGLIR